MATNDPNERDEQERNRLHHPGEHKKEEGERPTQQAARPESPIGREEPQASAPAPSPAAGVEPEGEHRKGARGTAAMDPSTRREVARKGGLAVSRNRQHMAEIGRKGGQSVSKNREHMARIGRKGGAASRGHH